MKKYISYFLPAILIIAVAYFAYNKILHNNDMWNDTLCNYDMVIAGAYVIWIIFELKTSHNDVEQAENVSDCGTREFYGFSQALTILSALWFKPVWHAPGPHHIIGFIIFISGIVFRVWAVWTLGKYYSHVVRKIEEHKIIDHGPYKYLRHPAYTGMIAAHAGITVFYFNVVTLVIFMFLLIPSIIIRIIIEEKMLTNIDGYEKFAKNRKRIIPCIW